jgi:hypothetical protein
MRGEMWGKAEKLGLGQEELWENAVKYGIRCTSHNTGKRKYYIKIQTLTRAFRVEDYLKCRQA